MSNPTDATRRGIINQGAFFSPYYLFDLLARRHADELDPEGREANRRLLRRPFRAAWARYGESGSTPGQAWSAWHRELFEALGFLGDPEGPALKRLETPVETSRHGLVPISHVAYPIGDEGRMTNDESAAESRVTDHVSRPPLVFVDLHGFGTDLDRDRFPNGGAGTPDGAITEEAIARAVEFALDYNQTRWAVVATGDRMRLYRKGGSVARQYLEVNFPALFDADRNDEWAAFWGLFRYEAFVPDPETGKCLLDRVLEESQRHASRIADDLRENIVTAVEALVQGVLDDPVNRPVLGPVEQGTVKRLFVECLYFLYRLLFILYAESRDLLPVGESPVYRDTYSVEHLREMSERALHPEDADKTYYIETLRALFEMLHQGFPPPRSALNPGFEIPPFNGQLFDPGRTALLDRCQVPDRAMREVIRELSLSRPRRRSGRRERYSYADLGVDQLGSIYEGLLVYEPTIVGEETVVAKVKGEERLVRLAQAEQYGLEVIEDSLKRPGAFVLRLWGGRRKGTGSYYTPQEITSFLVKEALEPLVEPIVEGCRQRDERGRPQCRPDEILELKVCDPAMGSGAFLIQACRYLAEAYGRARIAAGLDEDGRISQKELAHYKRRVAEKCLYGVDLNPLAVELAKVSLWLETLARDRPLTFLDAHLCCGNSLIGAPLRDEEGAFTVERISLVPDEALKEVGKEATKDQKAAARERIKRNREELKRLRPQKAGQALLPVTDWGMLSLREIETALADTLTCRLDLETSDEDLPLADAVELVATKEQLFDELQQGADSRYRQAKQVCDLWCAVWFWPEPGTEIEVEKNDQRYTVVVPDPPTTQVLLELAGRILDTDPGSLSEDERKAYRLTAEHVAREQHFFHWELEFPEAWQEKNGQPKRNGGFEAIIGNPPWDVVQPSSQEFWSNYDPLFRSLSKQDAIRQIAKFRTDQVMDIQWKKYETSFSQQSRWFKRGGVFRHIGRGKSDTYKLFLERGHNLLRTDGGLGLVLHSGLYSDLGSQELRRLLFDTCKVRYLLALNNERFIFPAVHHSFRFVLLSARRGGITESIRALFRLTVRNAVAPEDLPALLANVDSATLLIRVEDIRRFSPDTLSLMEFRNQAEIDIAARIYADHPLLGDLVPGAWRLRFTQELNMSSDSYLFRDIKWLKARGCVQQADRRWRGPDNKEYLVLYEGKMIHQYDPLFSDPRYWVCERETRSNLSIGADSRGDYEDFRLAYRLIARSTDEITSIATILPEMTFVGHSLAVLSRRNESTISRLEQLFASTLLNSFVINFVLRQKVSANITMFFVYQLPIPRLALGNPCFDVLVPRAARLICTVPEFADLWNEVVQRYPASVPTCRQPEYAAADPRERAQLRAEIDALVADLYALTEKDFAYILTTFPVLDRDQPALSEEPKSFVTRDLALLALFKLRGKAPPSDIVDFFASAGADIGGITGPLRDLEQRVVEATRLGALAYVPSGRGGDLKITPEDAEAQLRLFED